MGYAEEKSKALFEGIEIICGGDHNKLEFAAEHDVFYVGLHGAHEAEDYPPGMVAKVEALEHGWHFDEENGCFGLFV